MPRTFLTTISGRAVPFGYATQPEDKAGLLELTLQLINNSPSLSTLYSELDSLGATLNTEAKRDYSHIYIRGNLENETALNPLLTQILETAIEKIDQETLDSNRHQIHLTRDSRHSDYRAEAHEHFKQLVHGGVSQYGTAGSIDAITLQDVKEMLNEILISSGTMIFSAENIAEYYSPQITPDTSLNSNHDTPGLRSKFIKNEIKQKIVCLGFPVEGLSYRDYPIVIVANNILSSGLMGLVPEKLRFESSIAYYAQGYISMYRDRGVLYMYAGVSEENVIEAIKIMLRLYKKLYAGKFKSERLQPAKVKSVTHDIDLVFNDIEMLYKFVVRNKLYIKRDITYKDIVERINAVNLEDVQNYYKRSLYKKQPFLLVNGTLQDAIQTECEDLIKNFICD